MQQDATDRPRAVALIDGEHYLPVVEWAIGSLATSYDVVGAVFLGGTEKVGTDAELQSMGIPVLTGKPSLELLADAVDQFAPRVAVDLSDEPVVGYWERFEMASLLLASGVRYVGQDFRFDPPALSSIAVPAISVVGTGKRTGKTAIAGHIGRLLREHWRLAIVTMGRGGPEAPEILDGSKMNLDIGELISFADKGYHAASGCFGHAVMTGVLTIGCRRCGGGLSGGSPFFSNVLEGAKVAEQMNVDLALFDGSGATAPPVEVQRQVLIIGAHQPLEYIARYFGPFRIRRSSLVVLTGCEEPLADRVKVDAIVEAVHAVRPDLPVFRTVFRPRPLEPIGQGRVFLAMTAPEGILPEITKHLEASHGCTVVGSSPHLSNRPKLRADLASAPEYDVLLVELKAAGIDVAARTALAEGRRVVFVDNEPICDEIGAMDAEVLALARDAVSECRARTDR